MNHITVNGVSIEIPDGASVSVVNGRVTINGNPAEHPLGNLHIDVHGNLLALKVDRGSVEVHGSVHGNVDAGGSVACTTIDGDVDAGGSVACTSIQGNVDAGGSVNCGSIGGSVDAGGSIRRG